MNDNGLLLNLADPKVRAEIKAAKLSGFVTLDTMNSILPDREITADELETTLEALAQMGINITEELAHLSKDLAFH